MILNIDVVWRQVLARESRLVWHEMCNLYEKLYAEAKFN